MEIKIKVDAEPMFKELRGIKNSQLPFAFARTLTVMAQKGRDKMIQELPQHFTLRTTWYCKGPYRFNIEMADYRRNKFDSAVFSTAPWIVDFETGSTRTPEGKTFAVPTDSVRRTKRQLITKGQRPKAILRRSKRPAFILPTKSGAGIFVRVGLKGLQRGFGKSAVQRLYTLIHKAVIKPRLGFQKTVETVVTQQFNEVFIKEFDDALRNPK